MNTMGRGTVSVRMRLGYLMPLVLSALLSGCGGTMVERGYKGEEATPDQVGRLIVEPPMQLRSLNGDESLHKYLYSKTIMRDKRIIELKPGRYEAKVYMDYQRHWSELDQTHEYSGGDFEIKFNILPGHLYKIFYTTYDSGKMSAWVDEVNDWDKIKDAAADAGSEAWKLYHEKRYADALPLFQKAVRLDPNFGYAYYGSGKCYTELGDKRRALTDLQKAIALKPGDTDIGLMLGYVYQELGMDDAAVAAYTDVLYLKLDPVAAYNLGLLYKKHGNYKNALQAFDAYLRIYPSSQNGYISRAEVYDKLGDKAHAGADRRRAQELAPKR